jgi:multicomponent Na+:H+ antiporter subunit B
MRSEIFKLGAEVLKYLFVIVSIWLLLRGHNYPGGGFIAGLIAGSALIFKPLAFEIESMRAGSKKRGFVFLALGLGLVFLSAVAGLLIHDSVLEGIWLKIPMFLFEKPFKLGTPIVFDIGVYFTVIGFLFLIVISMMEEWKWK